MTKHYNKKSQTELRRFLRRNLSKAEATMWRHLSHKQILGYKFRRQYGVDQYSIDFYCPALKLAVEINGETHFRTGSKENDEKRQEHIEQYSIRFLRFTNEDVYGNLNGVLETIAGTIREMEKHPGLMV